MGYAAALGDRQLVALLRLDGPVVQTHAAEGEGDYRVPFSRTEVVYAHAYAEGEAIPTSDVLAQVATNRVGSRTVCVIPPLRGAQRALRVALTGCDSLRVASSAELHLGDPATASRTG